MWLTGLKIPTKLLALFFLCLFCLFVLFLGNKTSSAKHFKVGYWYDIHKALILNTYVDLTFSTLCVPPKGGQGCLMSLPYLESQGCWHLALCESPQREAGDVWCLSPIWNLRAVIWSHFATVSLVLLSSPVTFSVLSFSACWSCLLNFFQ